MREKKFYQSKWKCLAFSVIALALFTLLLSWSNALAQSWVDETPSTQPTEQQPSLLPNPQPTPASPELKIAVEGGYEALLGKIQQHGMARVIVKLDVPFTPLGKLNEIQTTETLQAIQQAQSALQQNLSGFNINNLILFQYIPFAAVDVDAAALEALANLPFVTQIEENGLHKVNLDLSTPRIGAPLVWARGFDGSGIAVAVLDSGVQKTHPFLQGKVISEACYSTNNAYEGSVSLCPGGVSQSTALDSAMPYLSGVCPPSVCDHGTHVAGIISGGTGLGLSGVAPGASLIAIQVFSYFPQDNDIYTWSSDYILGLERVYALRNTYPIAAVNMSFGGSSYSDQNSCDIQNQAVKAAIDNLRSVNILSVIASGNLGSSTSISRPACISSAVSVGATDDSDQVASYSNSADFLTLLAPGSAINSSIPPDQYASWNGTSMAAPHAAAAFALLRQAKPNATSNELLNALVSSGVSIIDQRNSIAKPRIQVNATLDLLLGNASTETTQRISIATSGTEANAASSYPSLSASGNLVAFHSAANNLVENDTNNAIDVFIHNRLTNQTRRVSIASGGSQADGDSNYPSLSVDGNMVIFQSTATNLVSNDTNGVTDIFVHNLVNGNTNRVSLASDSSQANGDSLQPDLSATGRYVVFTSYASNLVNDDTNNSSDVFLYDRQSGTTTRISVSSSGEQGNAPSSSPSVSADGKRIVFSSFASNLVPNDTNGSSDIFLRDLVSGQTHRISITSSGNEAHGHSLDPVISNDGKLIAFTSFAPDLVPNDTNDKWDIFVHDLQSGQTERVSIADSGIQSNGNSISRPALSETGRIIAFWSEATNLVAGDTNAVGDVFIHDRYLRQTRRVSLANDGSQGNGAAAANISLSADGTSVAFESLASNLVLNDSNSAADCFVRHIVYTLPAPTLIAPILDVVTTDWQPAFSWTSVNGAEQYHWQLKALNTQDGFIEQTFTPTQAQCVSSSTCSVQSPIPLSQGPYMWRVRALNINGAGAWSDEARFNTPSLPTTVSLIAPLGTIQEARPTFRWHHNSTVYQYRLWVYGTAGIVIRQEIDPVRFQCTSSSNECRFILPQKLAKGSYTWWIQAHNPSGESAWSAPASFLVE